MEEELNRSVRQGLSLTVMLIDLDHFKLYNDYNGHIAGDKALKKTAKILRSSVRDMDMVTRYGGEEFCIILPGTMKREAIFVAERVRRGIECEPFAGEEELPLGRPHANKVLGSRTPHPQACVISHQSGFAARSRLGFLPPWFTDHPNNPAELFQCGQV